LGALLKQAAAKQYPGFATGTSNSPAGTFTVGERGPELITLPQGSRVTTNGQLNAMSGGQVFIAENVIRGTDIVTVYKKASDYNSRNGY
jgi:SLT domain-containing protein